MMPYYIIVLSIRESRAIRHKQDCYSITCVRVHFGAMYQVVHFTLYTLYSMSCTAVNVDEQRWKPFQRVQVEVRRTLGSYPHNML